MSDEKEAIWRFENIEQADSFIDFVLKLKRGYLAVKSLSDPCEVIMSDGAPHEDCARQMMKAWQFAWMAGQSRRETHED